MARHTWQSGQVRDTTDWNTWPTCLCLFTLMMINSDADVQRCVFEVYFCKELNSIHVPAVSVQPAVVLQYI